MTSITAYSKGIYTFNNFAPAVLAAFSGREIAQRNWSPFLESLGIHETQLKLVKQEHTDIVINIRTGDETLTRPVADGLITKNSEYALGVLTADCIPVFFWDCKQSVVGIAHAGWRGLHRGIIPAIMNRMKLEYGSVPADIRAALGPAIRECCYQVGDEFKDYFPEYSEVKKGANPGLYTNLIAVATDQIIRNGIYRENIYDSGICTSCKNDRFYSARRENASKERILSIIKLHEETSHK